MSATTDRSRSIRRDRRRSATPRADDPRVVRSRAAATRAATALFLERGYTGTTMEDIAALAGVTRRTLYNNYPDKDALFAGILGDVLAYAEEFARGLRAEFAPKLTPVQLTPALHELARRLGLAILRPEIIALRRLIVREADAFPSLARQYYDRAPRQVIRALAAEFSRLSRSGVLRAGSGLTAAAQFAYLVVGAPLDRAMLTGEAPTRRQVRAHAREGVKTFLARYGTTSARARH